MDGNDQPSPRVLVTLPRHPERQPTLDALENVNDEVYFALLSAMKGMNLVLANMVEDDPTASMVLDAAITADMTRLAA